jgi:hypothetical protein
MFFDLAYRIFRVWAERIISLFYYHRRRRRTVAILYRETDQKKE